MPRRTKIQRYEDIMSLPNVTVLDYFLNDELAGMRGRWDSVFPKKQPVTLELACGKGDYVLALGARYPDRNFIGIDIKGDRIWKGAQIARRSGLTNVHFIRAHIDHLCNYIAPREAEEIWITFPDPYLRKSKIKKRLTHPVFLQRYARVIGPSGLVHLKTDCDHLFAFTLEIIEIMKLSVMHRIPDIQRFGDGCPDLDIQTYYEKQHVQNNKTIKYVSFRLNETVLHYDAGAFKHLT